MEGAWGHTHNVNVIEMCPDHTQLLQHGHRKRNGRGSKGTTTATQTTYIYRERLGLAFCWVKGY